MTLTRVGASDHARRAAVALLSHWARAAARCRTAKLLARRQASHVSIGCVSCTITCPKHESALKVQCWFVWRRA